MSGTVCRDGPEGASHKRFLTPFPAALAAVAWMSAASAGEVLTPEEQAERELEAKKQAPPALAVEPASLGARMEPREAVAGEEKTGGFGIRAGVVLPSSGESQDYGTNLLVGVSYRIGRYGSSGGPRPRVAYEVGLDIGMAEEVGGYSSVPIGARFGALFPVGSGYLLAGGTGVVEFVLDTVADERYTNYAVGLDIGGGLRLGSRVDVRVLYEVLLGSDNLGGQAVVSFGYRF